VSQAEHENNGSSFGRSEQILKECLHNLLMVSDERLLIAAMLPMTHCCYAANEHALLPDKLWGNERKIDTCASANLIERKRQKNRSERSTSRVRVVPPVAPCMYKYFSRGATIELYQGSA